MTPEEKRLNIQSLVALYGLNGTPAEAITANLWMYPDPKTLLWKKLNEKFYEYGRGHAWKWVDVSTGNGSPADAVTLRSTLGTVRTPAGSLGIPLITGQISRTNCGGFNTAVRQIAWLLPGFGDNECRSSTTTSSFLTLSGTDAIDNSWQGNVCTLGQSFDQLKCFKFTQHSWNRGPDNKQWDATTGMPAFSNETDFKWCELARIQGRDRWFAITQAHAGAGRPALPGVGTHFLIAVDQLKADGHLFPVFGHGVLNRARVVSLASSAGAWPTWLLTSSAELPPGYSPPPQPNWL